MLNIQPIRLLKGCHPSTGDTGSGCFLNVCSYLQGDKVITDRPSSVAAPLRGPLLVLNDSLSNVDRQALLPFVHRAMLTGDYNTEETQRALLVFRDLATDLTDLAHVPLLFPLDNPPPSQHVLSEQIAITLQRALNTLTDQRRYAAAVGGLIAVIVEYLDRALPRDVEPRPIVAARAALLVETRKEWGDKPLPRSRDEVSYSDYVTVGMAMDMAKITFLSGVDTGPNAADAFAYMLDEAQKHKPGKPNKLDQPNKPHGPVKLHKPFFF